MDAASQRRFQMIAQIQPFLSRAWVVVRSPKTTGGIVIGLIGVAVVGMLLPQQSPAAATAITAQVVWIDSLPGWLQPGGPVLFSLGFARIFSSIWFWFPVALLLFNSLVALADCIPHCWRRIRQQVPPLGWQYPLARRVEDSTRLSHFPDNFIELFQNRLNEQGFVMYTSAGQQRVTAASRRKWAWPGWGIFYLGLLFLIIAFLLTFFSLKTEHVSLYPLQTRPINVWQGQLNLTTIDPVGGIGQLTFTPDDGGPAQLLTWQRNRPVIANGSLVWPATGQSMISVVVSDPSGTLVLLDPLPANLTPTEHLRMPLNDSVDDSIYFTIPSIDMAVQASREGTSDVINVQIRRGDEAVLIDNVQVQSGQPFEMQGLTAVMSLEQGVNIVVRRDMGLPFYALAAMLIVGGGILVLSRPAIIWLIPDVKGMGGQLYGVLETFGSEQKMAQFLEELLAVDDSTAHKNGA
jgi:hypothetical protein